MKIRKWKRRIWSQEEDKQLKYLVEEKKITNWVTISNYFNNRSNKDCRDHYLFQLSPNIVRRKWTDEEEAILLDKFKIYGPKWVKLTSFFDKRSPDDLRNRFKLIHSRKRPVKKKIPEDNLNSKNPSDSIQKNSPNSLQKNSENVTTNNNNTQNEQKEEDYQSLFNFDENDSDGAFSNFSEYDFFI